LTYATLTDLWHGECRSILGAKRDQVFISSLTCVKFDQLLSAHSMEYNIDISEQLWLTKGRFTGLQRDYLEPSLLVEFIEKGSRVSTKRPQVAQMLCRMKPQRHVSYRWGNCILALTFRRVPRPQLTMYSRTSMITRMGGLDLALAWHVASLIAEESDEQIEDYAFKWYVTNLQHSSLQGVPYFYAQGLNSTWDKRIDRDLTKAEEEWLQARPVMKSMVRQLQYFNRLDAEGRIAVHGTRRRVREQRRAFLDGTMEREPVPLNSLDLHRVLEEAA
jgi:hypothetical protein